MCSRLLRPASGGFAHLCLARRSLGEGGSLASPRLRSPAAAGKLSEDLSPTGGQPPVPSATVSKVQVVIVPSAWGESSTAPHAITARPTRYCAVGCWGLCRKP